MIEFDDVFAIIRLYYRATIVVVIMVAVFLFFWFFKGQGGSENVGKTIDAVRTTVETNERRVDAIFDAAKAKESEVARDVAEKVTTIHSDDLAGELSGLLSDYREKLGR